MIPEDPTKKSGQQKVLDDFKAKESKLNSLDTRNNTTGTSDMNIYTAGLNGDVSGERFFEMKDKKNVNFVAGDSAWDEFLKSNSFMKSYGPENLQEYREQTELGFKNYLLGNVAPKPSLSGDEYTKRWAKKVPSSMFSKGFILTQRGDPTKLEVGALNLPYQTPDQIAEQTPYAIDRKGNVVDAREFMNRKGRNRMYAKEFQDPLTGGRTWVWTERKDNEWVDPSSIRSMFGTRSVDDGNWLGATGRGFWSSFVGGTTSGFGWLMGRLGDILPGDNSDNWFSHVETNSAMFGGAMKHQNYTEAMDPFSNWKSFCWGLGDGGGQMGSMMLTSYAGGLLGAAAGLSGEAIQSMSKVQKMYQKFLGGMPKALSLTSASATKASMVKNDLIARGVPEGDANMISFGMGVTAALTETMLGPDIFTDPLKNAASRRKLMEFVEKNVITSKYLAASKLGKTQMLRNGLARFVDGAGKYAIPSTLVEAVKEGTEEISENALDLGIKSYTNYIEEKRARGNLKELMNSDAKVINDSNGNPLYYEYTDSDGNKNTITVEEKNRLQRVVDNGGYYRPEELTMNGSLTEAAMAAITTLPFGVASFYMSDRSTALDKGDINDLAVMVRTGKVKMSELDKVLDEMSEKGRIPSRHLDRDGNIVEDQSKSGLQLYKDALYGNINAINAVMDKHGILSASTIRAMSDASGMNRFIVHGALGAAEEIESILDAKSKLQSGEKITPNDYLKGTETAEQLDKSLEAAKTRLDFFTKPKQEKVEVDGKEIQPEKSQAFTDFYNQQGMTFESMNRLYKMNLATKEKDEKSFEKTYKDNRKKGMLEGFVTGMMQPFIELAKKSGESGYKVLSNFRENINEIEKIRSEIEKSEIEERTERANRFTDVNNRLKSLIAGVGKYTNLSKEQIAEINAQHEQKLGENLKGIDDTYDSIINGLNKESDDYQKYVDEYNEKREQEKTAAKDQSSKDAKSTIETLTKKQNFNSVKGITEALSDVISEAKSTGLEKSVAQDVANLMETYSNLGDEFMFNEDVDIAEKAGNFMDMANEMTYHESNPNQTELTPEDIDRIHGTAIQQRFINSSALDLMRTNTDKIKNRKEVVLSNDDKKLLNELSNGVANLAYYLSLNRDFQQGIVEKDKNLQEHTQLNKRTRVGEGIEKSIDDGTKDIVSGVQKLLPFIGSEKDADEKESFRTNVLHLNMSYLTVEAILAIPDLRQILFSDDKLLDAGDIYTGEYKNILGHFIEKYKDQLKNREITSPIQLIDEFNRSTSEEFRQACRDLMVDLERLSIDFQSEFFKVNGGKLRSSENGKGIMQKVLEEIDKMSNGMSPFNLDLVYGYLHNQELYYNDYNDEVEIIDRNKIYRKVKEDGKEEMQQSRSYLFPVILINNVFQWSTIDSKEAYDKLRSNINSDMKEGKTEEPVPTYEQIQAVFLTAAHLRDPNNDFFLQAENQNKTRSEKEEDFVPNTIYIRGYAGSGKTSVILRNAIRIADVKDKPGIVIIAPSKEVGKISFNTFSDINGMSESESLMTYSEVTKGKQLPAGATIVIMDEATLLATDEIEKIKEVVKGSSPVVAIGDESQTRSSKENISQPIKRAGKKTIPIIKQFRTKIRTIKNFQECFRDIVFSAKNKVFPTLEYVEKDGKLYGGMYLRNNQQVIDAFMNDTDPDAMLVVESPREAIELRKRMPGRKIYSSEFEITDEENTCVSGLSAKRVYVAIDSSTYKELYSNTPKMIMTAASRAVELLVVSSIDGTSTKVNGTISGLTDYLKGNQGYKAEMTAEVERINRLLGDASKPSSGTNTSTVQQQTNPVSSDERKGTALASSTQGYKHVMERISGFVAKVTRKTKEDLDEDQVEENEKKTSVSTIVNGSINDRMQADNHYGIGTVITRMIRRIVAGKEDIDDAIRNDVENLGEESRIVDPMSKFMTLKRNAFIQSISESSALDGTIIPVPFLQNVLTINGEDQMVSGSPIGIRVIGEHGGKPVIRIIHIVKPASLKDVDTLAQVDTLLKSISNGDITPAKLAEMYKNGTIGSAGKKMIESIALYNALIGDSALVAGFEVLGVRNSWRTDNATTSLYNLKKGILIPAMASAMESMKVTVPVQEDVPDFVQQSLVNDRMLTAEEKREISQAHSVTLKEGAVVSYTDGEGKTHNATVNDMFMRFTDGNGVPMLKLSNGIEIMSSEVTVDKPYLGSVNREEMLYETGKIYAGGYVEPKGMSDKERVNYYALHNALISLITNNPATILRRKYVKTFSNGLAKDEAIHHAIVYEVDDDLIEIALEEAGLSNLSAKEKSDLTSRSKVVAIEGAAYWGKPFESERRLFRRGKEEGIILDNEDLSLMTEERKEEIRKRIATELRSDDPEMALAAARVLDQFNFAVDHANETSEAVTIYDVDVSRPLFNKKEESKEGLVSLGDVMADSQNMDFDPILNTNYIQTDRVLDNGSRMSSKPVFTINVVDRKTGKSVPIRVFTDQLEDISEDEFNERMDEWRSEVNELFSVVEGNDVPFGLVDNLSIRRYLDSNAKRIIDTMKNPQGSTLPAEFANAVEVYDGKYLRLKRMPGDASLKESYQKALLTLIDAVQKSKVTLSDTYVPFKTQDVGGGQRMITDLNGVKTLMKKGDNGFFGMNGLVIQLPVSNESIVENQHQQVESNPIQDAGYDPVFGDDTLFMRGEPSDLIDQSEMNRILSSILGEEFVRKNGDILNKNLQDPRTGEQLLGMVQKARITLQEFNNGMVDRKAVRHEAMHIITSCILSDRARRKLQKEIEEQFPDENYLEKLSEMFESPKPVKNTFIARVIAMVKHILYKIGLYDYTTKSLMKAADLGVFSGATINADEGVYAKKYNATSDLTSAIEVFGSLDLLDSFIEARMKLSFRSKMITNRFFDRSGETIGAAIKGVLNEWNQDQRNRVAKAKVAKDRNVRVHPSDLLSKDELGAQTVTWNGENGAVTKKVSEMTGEDYMDIAYYETNKGTQKSVGTSYLLYKLSDTKVTKSLVQRLFPEVNIDKMIAEQSSLTSYRVDEGVSSSGVINGDNMNETRDIKTTLAPFLKFFISSIPRYSDIKVSSDTLIVKHASQNGFVSFETIHKSCIDAAQRMHEISDKPHIKSFIDHLKDIAMESRGEKRSSILSLLVEIGDMTIVNNTNGVQNAAELDSRLKSTIPTGYYGFTTRNNLFADKAESVNEKGRIIVETLLVPMVNVYRSSVERNLFQIDETKERKRIVVDSKSSVQSVKGKFRSGVTQKLYDDDGFVTSSAMEQFSKKVGHDENGSIGVYFNREFVPVLIVDPSSKTITLNQNEEAVSHMYTIVRALGLDIQESAWTTVVEDNKSKGVSVPKNLWAMAAGVYVNASTVGTIDSVLQSIERYNDAYYNNSKVTQEQEISLIKDLLLENQEDYTRAPASHQKAKSGGVKIMKSMLREVYDENGLSFQSADRAMSFGEDTGILEDFIKENDKLKGVSALSYSSPNVMDAFMLINEMAKREMEITNSDSVRTTRDISDNNVQTVVMGSEITEMLTGNARRLMSIIKALGAKYKKSILNDMKGVSSIFTSIKDSVYDKFVPVFSIVGHADFDGWVGKTSSIDYNKAPKGRVYHTMINMGFINELNSSNNDNFYMVLDPHADKKNTRVIRIKQGSDTQRLFSVIKKEEVINGSTVKVTTVQINKKALINAIHTNVTYALNHQRNSLDKWVNAINRYGEKMKDASVKIDEGASLEQVQAVIEKMDKNFIKFIKKSDLISTYDYKITKEGITLGYATAMSSPHSIYDKKFCQTFREAASDPNASPDALYGIIKNQFFPTYRDFAEDLQDSGYKVSNAYFNALSSEAKKKKIADFAKAKSKVSALEMEKISKRLDALKKEEEKLKESTPTYESIHDNVRDYLVNLIPIHEQGLLESNGLLSDKGKKVQEQANKILRSVSRKDLYKSVYADLQKDYSIKDTTNFYDPSDTTKWNPNFEAFFFAYHIVNSDIAKFTKGGLLYTKDLVDYVKRSAGESAPGTKLDPTIKTGLPKVMRHLVVNFGGDTHPWSTKDGKLKQHGSLRSDGQGMINPIMAVLMQNSAGSDYGPVGLSMIKSVVHYHDFNQNSTMYLKQALRRITGSTIRMSKEDFMLLKVMNQAIWDMPFMNGLTYGKAFEDYRNGEEKYPFDTIVNHAVNTLNSNPDLKDRVIFQAIDPSAVKTGLCKIHELDDLVDGKGDPIEMSDENLMMTDTDRMRIQLNVEKDIYSSRKNLPIQILNLIGIIPGNEGLYQNLHTSIAKIIDSFTNKFIEQDGQAKDTESFVRSIVKNMVGSDSQRKVLHASTNSSITLSSIRGKVVSSLVSFVNDFVKPTMSGNTYAQGTCRVNVYRDKNGNVYTGLDAKSRIEAGENLEESSLKPMRVMYKGKELLHEDGNTVEMQVRSIMEDDKRRNDLSIAPAEVVMPYPYIRQFGLNPSMTLEQAREHIHRTNPERMDEFERSLDLFFLRIPTSNASAGGIARIVGFVQDSGNTILIPHEKNAIDGSDQDIDMLHVFFRTMQAKSIEDRDNDVPEFMDRSERVKIQNDIFSSISQYYYNPNNFEMTFKENDMQTLKDEANLADVEDSIDEVDENPARNGKIANMPASSQRQHRINQDGKAVGFFANMGAFFGKMISISNMDGSNLFNPNFTLLHSASKGMSSAIDFISKLINAATDNAKENILGRLNLNSRTASSISGLLMLGYTEEQIVRVMRSKTMRDASKMVQDTNDLDSYAKKMYEVLDGMDRFSDVPDGVFVEQFNNETNGNASSLYDVIRATVDATIEKKEGMEDYFTHCMYKVAMIGDAITRFGMMTDITKELPSSPEELRAKLYDIEEVLGMTVSDFLGGDTRSISEQIAFNIARRSSNRGYIGAQKANSYERTEWFMRDPANTLNVHEIARRYPNFMSALRLLDSMVNTTMSNVFYVDQAYNEGVVDRILRSNGMGQIKNAQKLKVIDSILDKYVIGKFFATLPTEKKMITLGKVSFDMTNPSDRVKFAYSYAHLIQLFKESDNVKYCKNSFVVSSVIDNSFEEQFPIVKMSIPYNTDASVIVDLSKSIQQIGKELGPKFDFIRATEMYNMLMYGHSNSAGSMSNVIGLGVESEFSDYVRSNRDELFSDEESILQTAVVLNPQVTTLQKNKSSIGYSHIKFNRSGRNRSITKRFGSILFKGQDSVDSRYTSEVNTFGSDENIIVPLAETVSLPLKDMLKLIGIKGGSVIVKSNVTRYVPGALMKGVEPNNGLYPVTFQAYSPSGDIVNVSVMANSKGQYKEFSVSMSEDQTKMIKDLLAEEQKKEDEFNCKLS